MATLEDIKKTIVMVNEGSGCLVRPMAGEEMYILTAKHVVEGLPPNTREPTVDQIKRFDAAARAYVDIPVEALVSGENYFVHPSQDAAIIKIPLIEGVETLMRDEHLTTFDGPYFLCGFPAQRRGTANPYSRSGVTVLDPTENGPQEATADNGASWTDIVGKSGGGIVRVHQGSLLLLGVQSDTQEGEDLGAIYFLPMNIFDEIVEGSDGSLKPLLPYYMFSFEMLKELAMQLTIPIPRRLDLARNTLRNFTTGIVGSQIHPYLLRTRYKKNDLLAFESDESDLLAKKLWEAWLEFLIILSVCETRPIDMDKIEALRSRVRLVFANLPGEWTDHLPRLLRSDFRGLGPNGVVIFATPDKTHFYELTHEVLEEIDKAIPEYEKQLDEDELQRFDQVGGASLMNYRYVHLFAFQYQGIIENLPIYESYTPAQKADLLDRLRQDFNQFLNARNN